MRLDFVSLVLKLVHALEQTKPPTKVNHPLNLEKGWEFEAGCAGFGPPFLRIGKGSLQLANALSGDFGSVL